MKILYVITKSNWGGAQRYVYDLATSLSSQGHDVSVVLGGNGLLSEKLKNAGINVFNVGSMKRDISFKDEIKTFFTLGRIIWKVRPDVVHVNSSKAGGIGAFIARLLWVKRVVFTAHAWAFNENRSHVQQFIIGCLHWLTIVLNHKTIAVSESVKNQVMWMPFVKNKIKVIHPASPAIDFYSREDAQNKISTILEVEKNSQAQFNFSPTTKWIGTLAELHPVKNLYSSIEAVDILMKTNPEIDTRYVIIGEGELKTDLAKFITERGLQAHVFLTGFVDEAPRLLKAFDVFVLPSFSEAFGYVIIEAGMAEVPVIASNVGGIPETVLTTEHNPCGILIAPRDKKAFALALRMTLNSEFDVRLQTDNFKKRIAENFSLDRMVKKTVAVYENK
ncbi:MAG: glycosyltransferase [bacterium]